MLPERYQQVAELYRAVAEMPASERAAFLDAACADDPALRREIESLLAYQLPAENFIETPAVELLAKGLAAESATLSAGAHLGHYRILSQLGVGGMGVVYLAEDTRLGRQVALKLLPPEAAHHHKAKKRLRREAQSAAALNHPNIVTLYAIEELEDAVFIVMEYVEGETLTARIKRGASELLWLLDAGRQVAQALAAAHAVGIIHRDIKPSNVIITPGGQLKLLDFGIARMTRPRLNEGISDAATVSRLTGEGSIIGTIAYMSPEQINGELLDARSDLFSLGTLLYEAATGERPFTGRNALAIMNAIVSKDPPPPSAINAKLPPAFDAILKGALAKDREQRYNSAAEFAAALISLKQHLASAADDGHSDGLKGGEARHTDEQGVADSGGGRVPDTDSTSFEQKLEAERQLSTRVITVRRKTAVALMVGIFMLLAAVALIAYKLLDRPHTTTETETLPVTETRLTNTGNIGRGLPAISPDGKYIAYAVADTQQTSSLWVRQLAASSSVRLIAPTNAMYGGATFSIDGTYIYYLMREEDSSIVALYRIPLLGGTPQKIIGDVDSPITFSPDGSRMVFRRNLWGSSESALFVAHTDGSNQLQIAALKFPETFGEPAWSPDGEVIACSAGHANHGINRYVVTIRVGDWRMQPISEKKWRWAGAIEWLPDSHALLLLASESPAEPNRIWHLSYPGGEAHRITNNAMDYLGMGFAAQANSVLVLQGRRSTNLWMIPRTAPSLAKKVSFGTGGYRGHLGWGRNGKVVFASETASVPDVSVMDEDGGNQKSLLGEFAYQATSTAPTVSPDGRYVVFSFDLKGSRNIWRMNLDGSNLVQLTQGESDDQPACSPDGRWVIYMASIADVQTLWKVSIDGGEALQLTKTVCRYPSVSPDGKFIACFSHTEASKGQWQMAIYSIDGGAPLRTFPQRLYSGHPPKWTLDGRALAYTDSRQANLWLQPVAGGAPQQLTNFANDLIFGYEWSPDGTQLACVRGIWERDLVLIKNIR